jgi:xanthine dehydrogenase YagR molybdenum-binding subunit
VTPAVGKGIARIDARAKVTGAATYAADTAVANVAHAVIVGSTIARGTLHPIDATAAEGSPGVIAVLRPGRVPALNVTANPKNPGDRVLQLLQDDQIHYVDQPIAVVVADTLEHAQHGARLVTATYTEQPNEGSIEHRLTEAYDPGKMAHGTAASARGDFAKAFAGAPVRVEQTYTTPIENHNPMEPHATVAVWQGAGALTVYDATQGIFGVRNKLAATFGLEPTQVRVIDKFVGGGFGCKGGTWSHVALAGLAAKVVGKPVKLVVTRPQMFSLVGHRPKTIQDLKLGADRSGKLVAIQHAVISETSQFDQFVEPSAQQTRMLYSCPNVVTSHHLVRVDIPTPTFMRAPGESTGTFAIESAMDELAVALRMDPVQLRIVNHADSDEDAKKPFSSKSLLECYRRGAAAFGWDRRNQRPGAMRDGDWLVGHGMATATYPMNVSPASAIAKMKPDGTLVVLAGTQDIGTGAYTVFTQIAADAMDLPVEQVHFDLGDTTFPETPVSGGSQTTASTGSAVKLACTELRAKLENLRTAPGQSWGEIVKVNGEAEVTAEHKTTVLPSKEAHSCHSFGAVFCEARVDVLTREVRVARLTGVYAAGKIINPRTAHSQFLGGLVWAIGMALHEETVRDPRTARAVTRDLADYHVPVAADMPVFDIQTVDEDDPFINALGAKGIGEIGITGGAAAIANAIYSATGIRVRDLPIRLDRLMA